MKQSGLATQAKPDYCPKYGNTVRKQQPILDRYLSRTYLVKYHVRSTPFPCIL